MGLNKGGELAMYFDALMKKYMAENPEVKEAMDIFQECESQVLAVNDTDYYINSAVNYTNSQNVSSRQGEYNFGVVSTCS